MEWLASIPKAAMGAVRDFIYPPICFVCERQLETGDERVCDDCLSSLSPFHPDEPVWHEMKNRFSEPGFVSDFLSCYYFEKEGPLQSMIHGLKYNGLTSMGVLLGRDVGRLIATNSTFAQAEGLVPVPLHPLKQRERGYNQAVYVCRGISEMTAIPVHPSLLRRSRYTETQTKLGLEERKLNVEEAFEIDPRHLSKVNKKTIIVVDDVITTGSTIAECARVLLVAGAKQVLAVSVAVAR